MSTGSQSSTRQLVVRRAALALVIAAFSVAPLASATRAWAGGSFGSRGSRTFSMPSATPTARACRRSSRARHRVRASTTAWRGWFPRRWLRPWSARRFLGAGLFGMLFGGGFGGGLGGGMSIIGLLLQARPALPRLPLRHEPVPQPAGGDLRGRRDGLRRRASAWAGRRPPQAERGPPRSPSDPTTTPPLSVA